MDDHFRTDERNPGHAKIGARKGGGDAAAQAFDGEVEATRQRRHGWTQRWRGFGPENSGETGAYVDIMALPILTTLQSFCDRCRYVAQPTDIKRARISGRAACSMRGDCVSRSASAGAVSRLGTRA